LDSSETIKKIINEASKGFLGNLEIIEDCVLALFSGLHVLVEDISGVGKTTLVKCIAKACGLNLGRIQFTPDLLPGEITGMNIWDSSKKEFVVKFGPIFNDFILGDEINRASPRTQSALLEAMEEKTVTIDGRTYDLPSLFTVFATKNPSYYSGTFDMPESQIDRFGIQISPGYPTRISEKNIVRKLNNTKPENFVSSVTSKSDIEFIKQKVKEVKIADIVLDYAIELVNKTRNNPDIKFGISTRGLQQIIFLSQSKAFYSKRDFVIPEDIIYSYYKVLPHKIILTSNAILSDLKPIDIIKKIKNEIKIPIGI